MPISVNIMDFIKNTLNYLARIQLFNLTEIKKNEIKLVCKSVPVIGKRHAHNMLYVPSFLNPN